MKKTSIVTTIVLVVTGCDQGNEYKAPPPPTVTVAPPAHREVTTYDEFTGRLAALETVEVRARVKGFLEPNEDDFREGTKVEAGDLLFTIERDPFEAVVAAAKAELASREASLQLAEITLQKAQAAADKGAVTALEIAEFEAQRNSAKAAVDGAQAAVDAAQIDLDYTFIRAPIAGRISRRLVDEGNLVGSGESTLLTTIVRDDPINAYFNVSERFLLAYLGDQERRSDDAREHALQVLLRFADGSDYDMPGIVDFADNRVDPATGTLLIRAEFPNPTGKLFPGLFARVRIPRPTSEQYLVPELSLQRDLAGTFVLVADASGMVERRDVELGVLVGNERVILAGLDASDRVIVNGVQRARPGVTVTTEESSGTPSGAAPPPADPQEAPGG